MDWERKRQMLCFVGSLFLFSVLVSFFSFRYGAVILYFRCLLHIANDCGRNCCSTWSSMSSVEYFQPNEWNCILWGILRASLFLVLASIVWLFELLFFFCFSFGNLLEWPRTVARMNDGNGEQSSQLQIINDKFAINLRKSPYHDLHTNAKRKHISNSNAMETINCNQCALRENTQIELTTYPHSNCRAKCWTQNVTITAREQQQQNK